MHEDIVDKLKDLLKQATAERSHYYVAGTCREAIAEIERLRADMMRIESFTDDQGGVVKIVNEMCRRSRGVAIHM